MKRKPGNRELFQAEKSHPRIPSPFPPPLCIPIQKPLQPLAPILIEFGRVDDTSVIILFIYMFLLPHRQKSKGVGVVEINKVGEGVLKSIVTYLYCHSMTNDRTFAIGLALCQCVSYRFYIKWTNVIDEVPK